MASILKVDKIRVTGSDSDAISFDGSGNITIPKNVTFNGTGGPTRKLIKEIVISSNTNSVEFVHGSAGVVLDTTYSRYEIHIDTCIPTNAQNFMVYLSNNGGTSYFGDGVYTCLIQRSYTNGSSTTTDTNYNANYVLSNYGAVPFNASKGGVSGVITASGLGIAQRTIFRGQFNFYDTSSFYILIDAMGAYESNTQTINGIQMKMSSGDIASGTFKLYGIK